VGGELTSNREGKGSRNEKLSSEQVVGLSYRSSAEQISQKRGEEQPKREYGGTIERGGNEARGIKSEREGQGEKNTGGADESEQGKRNYTFLEGRERERDKDLKTPNKKRTLSKAEKVKGLSIRAPADGEGRTEKERRADRFTARRGFVERTEQGGVLKVGKYLTRTQSGSQLKRRGEESPQRGAKEGGESRTNEKMKKVEAIPGQELS